MIKSKNSQLVSFLVSAIAAMGFRIQTDEIGMEDENFLKTWFDGEKTKAADEARKELQAKLDAEKTAREGFEGTSGCYASALEALGIEVATSDENPLSAASIQSAIEAHVTAEAAKQATKQLASSGTPPLQTEGGDEVTDSRADWTEADYAKAINAETDPDKYGALHREMKKKFSGK